jgi:hypothetical protein
MSFYRASDLRSAGLRTASRSGSTARQMLAYRGLAASDRDYFDIFLSHSYQDADVILGIVERLEAQRLSVYVDWMVDAQLDRTKVNAQTAALLRKRMRQCESMIFATSTSSPTSKWMPWELGYFDGAVSEQISIMPIEGDQGPGNHGQEYLGLYRRIEALPFVGGQFMAAVSPDGATFTEIHDFAMGLNTRRPIPY